MIDIHIGDCRDVLKNLSDKSVNCCVTSPPYWGLRDYQTGTWEGGDPNCLLMRTTKISKDTVTGQDDGWYLRQDIIWHKPNPMPESVKDRCTKSHEYIFLFSKNKNYYYDNEAIKEKATDWGTRDRVNGKYHNEGTGLQPHSGLEKSYETKNKRSVWTVTTKPYREAHFAVFPTELIEPCVKAGCPEDGTVLDPFGGSGTTGLVADRLGRNAQIIELNKDYIDIANKRVICLLRHIIPIIIDFPAIINGYLDVLVKQFVNSVFRYFSS